MDAVNAPWTDEETISFVEVWAADDVQHSLKTCIRNGHIFAEIAEKMATLGFLRTAEQCQIRIRRLKKAYRRYCNNRRLIKLMRVNYRRAYLVFLLSNTSCFPGMEDNLRRFDTLTFSPRCSAMT